MQDILKCNYFELAIGMMLFILFVLFTYFVLLLKPAQMCICICIIFVLYIHGL